jgi:methionyl-tRNA formyltransferase
MITPRIIFLGTPEFAVSSLEALHSAGYNVAAVVTAPDSPAGRGLKLQPTPVKVFALEKGIPVLQPEKLKDEHFLSELRSFEANLQVVVAFRMLPETVWAMPELGTFNLHASLLPQYRGAAPINHAIMNGDTETGVTTFFLKHEIDTGNIIFQEKVPIGTEETAGELHDRLMTTGAGLVIRTVRAIEGGNVRLTSQDELIAKGTILKPAPKIFHEDCRVDWTRPVIRVYNKVRGLSPYPGAFCEIQSPEGVFFQLKIYRAKADTSEKTGIPGGIMTDGKHFLRISCADGWLDILEIQQAGKRKMSIQEFLRGFPVNASYMVIPE